QLAADRVDADLRAVAVLGLDVPATGRVVTDEDGAESGNQPTLAQRADPDGKLGLDRGESRAAVHLHIAATLTRRRRGDRPTAAGRTAGPASMAAHTAAGGSSPAAAAGRPAAAGT